MAAAAVPYSCTVMPGVEVTSASAPSRSAVFRSIARPIAVRGALAGSTSAVHPVPLSPSMARLGSPKLPAGRAEGLYVEAALVSSKMAADLGSGAGWEEPPVLDLEGVV